MGCIGHKAAPSLLRCLQAVGEAVELGSDLADFICAPNLGAMAVGSLPHRADGLEQAADPPAEHPGKQQAHAHHQHRHHCGNGDEILLQVL